MADNWFCKVEGRQIGPLTTKQIKSMANGGRIDAQTPVRRGEEGKWRRATAFRGLLPAEATPVSASPARAKRAPARATAPPTAAKPPVAAPAPMPVATPVAAAPVGIAVGAPVAAAPVSNAPRSSVLNERRGRRSSNTPIIAIAVVGLLAAVAFAGGTAYWLMNQKPTVVAKKNDDAKAEPKEPVVVALTDAERLATVSKWRAANTTTLTISGSTNAKVAIEAVWQGSEPNAISSKPDQTDQAATERALGLTDAPKSAPAAAGGRYLFVRVALMSEEESKSLHYAGWNAPGGAVNDHQARLYNDQGTPLAPVSMTELSDAARRSASELRKGETVVDLLVFQASASSGPLKLVLPGPAIGVEGKQYGFQIPASMIGQPRRESIVAWYEVVEPTAPPAATPAEPTVVVTSPPVARPRANRPADLSELATRPGGDDTPVGPGPATPPVAAPAKPVPAKPTSNQPKTIEELKALINGSDNPPVERKPPVKFASPETVEDGAKQP